MEATAVYYDFDYGSTWISPEISLEIKDFFKKNNFSVLDAKELKKFMLSFLNYEIENPVVVFSMDKAPDTILNSGDANSLVRKFLDAGGKIVWIGDIPFWHIGRNEPRKADKDFYQTGAHMAILGVNPVVRTASSEPVNITRMGKTFGLKVSWSGVRSIDIAKDFGVRFWWENIRQVISKGRGIPKVLDFGYKPKDRGILVLGESQYLTARPVILLKKKSRIRLRSVEFSLMPKVNIQGRNEELTEGKPYEKEFWKTYANAWFKNFRRSKPLSGFFRIWDYSPTVMTQNMLDDLYNVAIYGIIRDEENKETNS